MNDEMEISRFETMRDEQPRRMLSIEQVLELVPLSPSTLYRMEREGRFPRGRAVSGRGKAWFADEVAQWQRQLAFKHQRR